MARPDVGIVSICLTRVSLETVGLVGPAVRNDRVAGADLMILAGTRTPSMIEYTGSRAPSPGWAIVEAQLSSGRMRDSKMCSKSARVA
jgi:hypothetical protein